MRNTPPASPSRLVDPSSSDRHDGGTQRLGVLMEKYTQPQAESNGERGDAVLPAWQSQRALAPLPASQTSDPMSSSPSLAEASSQLSRWLAGYFTDPICGLKGVVMVSLFEALDEVCADDEPWDGEGEAPDLFVVRGMISGGLMDGLGWETGEAWEEGVDEDLAAFDGELRASYPAVYGIRGTNDVSEDGCGFPSVSVGPGANGPPGREEETCEQLEDGLRECSLPGRGTQLLEVVEDVPGRAADDRDDGDDRDGEGGEGGVDGRVHVSPSPPVGDATAAAVGELLRLGDVFATEGSVCDRDLRDAADLVARRLRKGGESGSGQGEKNTQNEEREVEEDEDENEDDSEIVPNSQEDDEGLPMAEQQRLQEAPNDGGFAVPLARLQEATIPATNDNKSKGGTPSNQNEYNPESDPYLLSGLHATADCLAMVDPTAREDVATEPWVSIPNMNTGGANPVVCDSRNPGRVAHGKQKRSARGGPGARMPAKKARTPARLQEEDFDVDETEAQEGSISEYSDTACPDELSDGVEEDDEGEDEDVQVRNRPHRMIATCPPESQASAGESPEVTGEPKPRVKSKRKSGRVAAQREARRQVKEAEPKRPQRNLRRSVRRTETPNENTEDMLIGEYVEEQRKIGCSKCRYKGCRACRGYTLKELAQRKGVLDGISFMISRDGNTVGTKAQAELVKTIEGMGGQVLASLGDLVKFWPGPAKTKANHVDAVLVTSNATSRTLKCIAARVIGLPMISPSWIAACEEKKRLGGFTARTPHVISGKGCLRPSGPLLNQRRVYLVLERPSANAQDITALIKLLGGVPVRGSLNAKTDLVLYDGTTGSAQLNKEIGRVKREARKLRRPAHPLSWLTDAIAKGETDRIVEELEEALGPITAGTSPTANKSKIPKAVEGVNRTRDPRPAGNAGRQVVPETEGDRLSEEDLEALIEMQQAASEQRRQNEKSRKMKYHLANRQSDQRPRKHRALEESAPNTFRETDDPFCQPMAHPFQGVSSAFDIECTWKPVDDPLTGGTPPEGMRPTSIRKYFSSMLSSNQETIGVGDFVELVPGPGVSQPLVAQVLALWKQVGRPKGSCLYGRFLRYYRFDETSLNRLGLKSADNQNRVYKTSHVEENVPLASVLNQCRVEILSGVDAPTELQTQRMSDEGCSFLCTATYDFETGALAPIE